MLKSNVRKGVFLVILLLGIIVTLSVCQSFRSSDDDDREKTEQEDKDQENKEDKEDKNKSKKDDD